MLPILVTFLITLTKSLIKQLEEGGIKGEKEGGLWSVTERSMLWQEDEVADHIIAEVRKMEEMNTDAQLHPFCGTQALRSQGLGKH